MINMMVSDDGNDVAEVMMMMMIISLKMMI